MANPDADLVLVNGSIYTVDASRSTAAALAVVGSKIAFVGDNAGARALAGRRTRVIDLQGRLVLPAFIDSHCHALSGVGELYEVMLHALGSVDACRKAIAGFLASHPGIPALQGGGWINAVFGPHGPSAALLDDLAPDIPVVLASEDYHSAWVNSCALRLAGISRDTPDPAGGIIERDEDGNPSGTLRETAAALVEGVVPPYGKDRLLEGLRCFQEMAHRLGITTAYIPGLPAGDTAELEALRRFEAAGEMALRFPSAVEIEPHESLSAVADLAALRAASRGRQFHLVGAKMFMDGVLESGTAYLEAPYRHKPESRGELQWDPGRYRAMCAALDQAGLQIHVHSIGDAATRITLDGLAHARQLNGPRDARPMITHLQLVNPADIGRFARLGVVAVPQPYWFVVDMYYRQAVAYVGQALADRQYPMRSFFDQGVVVAAASDYPVTRPPNPLDAIEIGVTRTVPSGYAMRVEPDFARPLVPAECVSVEQMIEAFTINGAYASFLEADLGSLEPGKKADLIVLDRDLRTIPPQEIHTASVLLTVFEGRQVYHSSSFPD